MINQELISIIMPLYNKEKYIDETIKNIINQTYKNWELIIVEDCSVDDSYEIAKKYENEKIKIIKNKENLGVAESRNIGLNISKGRYICFQDADDLWDEERLEKQLNYMKEKKCGFSYTGFSYIKKNGKIKKVNIQEELRYEEALKNIRILTISAMIDTKIIDKKMLFMPNIPSEEIATWWNILENGYTAYGIQESLVYYRRTKNSLTDNKIESVKNRWNLYRKYKKFSIVKSLYYFSHYIINAIIKRI